MPHTDFASEQELFRQISEGNRNAFRVLFGLYNCKLITFIYKLTKSEATASELTQDIFVKLWVNREDLAQVNNVQGYLFAMASNRTIDHLRKVSTESRVLANIWMQINRFQASAEEAYDAKEYGELINEAVVQLSPQKQKIFRLSRYDGLNHEEIAAHLNLSKSTVKNHIVDTLRHIKTYILRH